MSKINPKYANSQMIDYNRWSDHPEVDRLVAHLLENYPSRKKADFAANMKVVLLNLYQAYLSDPEKYIAYHRGAPHYTELKSDAESRYHKNPHISQTKLVGVVDHLDSSALIENVDGGSFPDEHGGRHGFLSRMRATQTLVTLWQEYQLTPAMIGRFKPDEVIILRGVPYKDENNNDVKPLVYYKDNRAIRSMRKVLHEYNALIDSVDIRIDVDRMSDEDVDTVVQNLSEREYPAISINYRQKHVHRVFNNNSWEQGGRFYGAWWIGCPSILRKYITINGKPTVELDYSGIHINLLYALEGINYAEMKEDPYTLDDGVPDRNLNKLILLTALNAENEVKARDAVFDQLRKKKQLDKYKLSNKKPITAKISLLKQKHSKIAKYIANGEGIYLQYHDSCIIEKLLKYGITHSIPVLSVHDSVVVQTKYKSRIKDRMLKYYSEYLHSKLGCKDNYQYSLGDDYTVFANLINSTTYFKSVNNYKLLRDLSILPNIIIDNVPRFRINSNISIKASDTLKRVRGVMVTDKLDIDISNGVLNIRLDG
jgi:hypothetical protein